MNQSFLKVVKHSHSSIRWNTVISQFDGTQSFLNLVECGCSKLYSIVVEHSQIFILVEHFLNLVEHSHFLIWWKFVNCKFSLFGVTQSFLNFVEQSFLNLVECGHSKLYSIVVEHGRIFILVEHFLNLVEHSHFYF